MTPEIFQDKDREEIFPKIDAIAKGTPYVHLDWYNKSEFQEWLVCIAGDCTIFARCYTKENALRIANWLCQ